LVAHYGNPLRRISRLIVLGICVSACAQNPSVASLIREGNGALDAGDLLRASRAFEQARQASPENLEANRGLLLSDLQLGQLAEAEKIGRDAVEHWPKDADLQHYLGLVYFKQSKNSDALVCLRRSAILNSGNYGVHFDTALVLLSESNYPEAATELEKAVKLDPKVALPHVLLGRAYQNTNRSVQAVEQFQTALRLDPAVPLGHYHLGFAYASLGHNGEAIAEFEKELLRSPSNPQVLYQLGHRQLEAGNLKSAVEHLSKATEINPNNGDAYYDLGKAILSLGNFDEAQAPLRRAIELKPSDPSPHYQLARALEKAGKKEQAKQEMETFTALKRAQPTTGGMASGPIQ